MFKISKSLVKGAVNAVGAYLVTEVGTIAATGNFPSTVEEWKDRGPAIGVSLGYGALKVVANVIKHRNTPGNPLYKRRTGLPR